MPSIVHEGRQTSDFFLQSGILPRNENNKWNMQLSSESWNFENSFLRTVLSDVIQMDIIR